ncbi:MAG: hypothetical protein A2504_13085 [Bdellovibrionales bacterium RIFOXYD12_FULL_39_22]|nr:MAG: hypothetical protein A2385_00885 [Bdellovibrionales bacterium RIFOXYB1_FULL_39_21]OFZ43563.1 MAG: hypothetical protein A2485_12555 [Bdellovibrionales bacterium RIFOXYC12_FULL_39_17]OFZ44582.1 MAG: hypothetical protein A2404_10245 [Bdellovibrionales bacterium RIFOXYC1_FULL_39_130]OFZ76341.1 MAG: hypothetical protein A2560_06865 [Bdellovibrionales bacterium RIFOXYD1_FULL_39_84]OFZ94607.1 MAG: hypothetical protein A2504_13085 [Bdellovibrionales bacterium RIFOXYD12_FULL_39_22]
MLRGSGHQQEGRQWAAVGRGVESMNDMIVKEVGISSDSKNRSEELGSNIDNSRDRRREGEREERGIKNESRDQGLYRVVVNKGAERALSFVMDKVNEGFIGGKVNKTEVANWIMIKFKEAFNEDVLREIRMEYFDEVAVLESILRRAKESGKVPSEFKSLLQKQMILDEAPKKKIKKALTGNGINDVMDADEEIKTVVAKDK